MHSILHPNSNSQMSTESFVIRRVSLIVQQLELAFSVYSSLSSHDDNDNVDNVRKLCFKSLPGGVGQLELIPCHTKTGCRSDLNSIYPNIKCINVVGTA